MSQQWSQSGPLAVIKGPGPSVGSDREPGGNEEDPVATQAGPYAVASMFWLHVVDYMDNQPVPGYFSTALVSLLQGPRTSNSARGICTLIGVWAIHPLSMTAA